MLLFLVYCFLSCFLVFNVISSFFFFTSDLLLPPLEIIFCAFYHCKIIREIPSIFEIFYAWLSINWYDFLKLNIMFCNFFFLVWAFHFGLPVLVDFCRDLMHIVFVHYLEVKVIHFVIIFLLLKPGLP